MLQFISVWRRLLDKEIASKGKLAFRWRNIAELSVKRSIDLPWSS
jgi:hypothetical protein